MHYVNSQFQQEGSCILPKPELFNKNEVSPVFKQGFAFCGSFTCYYDQVFFRKIRKRISSMMIAPVSLTTSPVELNTAQKTSILRASIMGQKEPGFWLLASASGCWLFTDRF